MIGGDSSARKSPPRSSGVIAKRIQIAGCTVSLIFPRDLYFAAACSAGSIAQYDRAVCTDMYGIVPCSECAGHCPFSGQVGGGKRTRRLLCAVQIRRDRKTVSDRIQGRSDSSVHQHGCHAGLVIAELKIHAAGIVVCLPDRQRIPVHSDRCRKCFRPDGQLGLPRTAQIKSDIVASVHRISKIIGNALAGVFREGDRFPFPVQRIGFTGCRSTGIFFFGLRRCRSLCCFRDGDGPACNE